MHIEYTAIGMSSFYWELQQMHAYLFSARMARFYKLEVLSNHCVSCRLSYAQLCANSLQIPPLSLSLSLSLSQKRVERRRRTEYPTTTSVQVHHSSREVNRLRWIRVYVLV